MKRLLLIAAAGVITVVGATVGGLIAPAVAGDGPLPPEVQEVRAAVARYHSFGQAERDGYSVEGEPCVASPAGTMGIHAVNPPLLADPAIDARQPELLLYVPKSNGKLELVGVEYWTIALANTAAGPRPWFGAAPPPLASSRRRRQCSGRRSTVRWKDIRQPCPGTTTCMSGSRRRTERGVRDVQSRDLLLNATR